MEYILREHDWLSGMLQRQMFFAGLQHLREQDSEKDADPSQDQDETPPSVPLPPKLSPFFDNNKLSDITLMVGSSIFHTHKLILSSWSPVFKKMLLKGSKTDEPHVLDEAQEYEVIFSDFLKFMYTETIEMSKDTVYSFHKLAKKYEVEEIRDLCEEFLIGEVSDESIALQKLNEAEEYGFTKVYDHCFKVLETNFFRLSDQSIKKISPSLFVKLLESSDLVVRSERHLFSQALVWLTGDERKDEYREHIEDVISKIRFAHMSLSELSTLKSEQTTLPKMSDSLKQRLQHSLDGVFQWKALVSCEEELNQLPHHIRSNLFERHCVEPRICVLDWFANFLNLKLSKNNNDYSDGLNFPVTSVSANNTLSEESSQWSVTGTTFYDEESKGNWGIHYWFQPSTKHINKKYRLLILTNIYKPRFYSFYPNPITSKGVVTRQRFKVELVLPRTKIKQLKSVRIKVVIMVNMRHLTGQLQTRKETEED